MKEGTKDKLTMAFVVAAGIAIIVLFSMIMGRGLARWNAEEPEVSLSVPQRTPGVDFESVWLKTDEFTTSTGVIIARTIAGRDTDGSSPSVHTVVIGRVPPKPQPVRKPVPVPKPKPEVNSRRDGR